MKSRAIPPLAPLSVQLRVVLLTSRSMGFGIDEIWFSPSPKVPYPNRYLLSVTFNAVFPSPNMSHVAPSFGAMSFQLRFSIVGNVTFRFGVKSVGPRVCSGKLFLNWSNRIPPERVHRRVVHLFCTKKLRSR